MVAILIAHEARTLQRDFALIVPAAILFTVLGGGLGYAVGRTLALGRGETATMLIAFPSRSLSIATLVAVNALGRSEFVGFAIVFFVVQTLLLTPLLMLLRPARTCAISTPAFDLYFLPSKKTLCDERRNHRHKDWSAVRLHGEPLPITYGRRRVSALCGSGRLVRCHFDRVGRDA
jgi:hypothetical protein